MFRSILCVLFLFVHLSCCDRVEDNQKVTDQVLDTQISTTTDKELIYPTVDDSIFDLRATVSESTETTTSIGSYYDDTYTNNLLFCEIRNVSHISYPTGILIRWDNCGDKYNVNITKAVFDGPEIPQFRRLDNNSMYNFTKLDSCTAYNISIKSDSGDEYLTTIRTLPGEIEDLRTNISNKTTNLNWGVHESQDCKTFNLRINGNEVTQTRSNSVQINYNQARCTTIEIYVTDTSNITGSISTRAVPGTVQDFEAIFNPHNITLSWMAPEDTTCVTGYMVRLNDDTPTELDDSITNYTYSNLEACTQYTVAVAAYSNTGDIGEYSSQINYTSTPSPLSAVQNLNLEVIGDILNATWSPPNMEGACVTAYGIIMWDQTSTIDTTTTNTYYEFSSIVPCKIYNVMIKPMVGYNEGVSDTAVEEIVASVTNPPTLRSTTPAKTSCTISLQLDTYSINMCEITKVIVNCTAEGNENFDWIIDESNVEYSHTDSTTSRQVSILVENLSEYTNYVCHASVINTAGESGKSEAIEFRTLEEVPSAPQNLIYTEEEDYFLISWTEPYKIPGILGNYGVAIKAISPLHYIPEECSVDIPDIYEETNEKQYYFRNYLPNYMYNVAVAASTGAGFGDAATINITTQAGVSEVPRNVTYEFMNILGDTYNVTLIINWESPCNTNGQLNHFEWNLDGQPLDSNQDVISESNTVLANEEDSNNFYELNLNIQARYNYTFTLAAYTDGNTRGEEYEFNFLSPDGFPAEPQNLKVDKITATSAEISWEEPVDTNGDILSYRLTIRTTGPIHYIPEECDINYSESVEYILDSTIFLYLFESMPHFQYTVSISAATSAGDGLEETAEFTTLQAESEAPRNVSYDLDTILGKRYNASLYVSWSLPCNTNGNLIYFMWSLEGVSLETHRNFRQAGFVNANEPIYDINYGLFITNLLPMSTYVLTLSAFVDTGNTEGQEYKLEFQSPEGYSSPPLGLRVEDLTANTGNIFWQESLNKNGKIRAYQIVITTDGPEHYVPSDCHFAYDEIVDNVTLDSTTFNFTFMGFPNFKYRIAVAAVNGVGFGYESVLYITSSSTKSTAPRNVNYKTDIILGEQYNATLYTDWLLPCNTNGNLTYFMWTLQGTSLETGDSFNQTDFIQPNEQIEDVNYGLTLTNLLSMSNYTLRLAAFVDGGDIKGEEYEINFQSPDGYSSPPLNLRVENLTATAGNIVWEEPLNKNGEIQFYRIVITTDGPAHYIPDNCEFTYDEIVNNVTLDSTTFDFEFMGFANFKYTVAVAAANNAGYGYENIIYFTTLSAQSEQPRNVIYSTNNQGGDTYNFFVSLTWQLPCNTNGNLNNFLWILAGQSLENDIYHNESGRVAPLENIYYEMTVSNLFPYYSYKLSIAASVGGEEEIIGEEYIVEFTSDDGYPSVPLNLRVGTLTAYNGEVLWDEPSPKNGEIQNYMAIITSTGPLYDLPNGCTYESGGTSSAELESNIFTFTGYTQPNFKYTANVAASTRAGYGPEDSIEFSTPTIAPEEIENIVVIINDTKSEVYQSSVTMSFDKQCKLYDDFSHYAIEIYGERQEFSRIEFIRNVTEYENNSLDIPLTAQFVYDGLIKIYTKSGSNSGSIIQNFIAPAGVPSSSTADIQPPEASPTKAVFILNDEIFDNTQGDIIYYAIIVNIGTDNSTDIGGGFDFWSFSSWPESGFWSDTAEEHEYQVTPEYWNPFGITRSTNYTYIIGESNCSSVNNDYCNGPLRPNTQYALRVRGFTEAAYRDTSLVYFTTPSEDSYLALILGVIFGSLVAILILIFIFILWRRRKKETEGVNETTVVPQTPMPPPIPKDKFVEHCQMFEDNRSELKAEYSHLDRLSALEKPSSFVAIDDSNKKKNRYINIMPYDDTRVKLTTDSNDNYEDYINASYIRGYSGNYEYIATQGPMESTLEDFWRMIIQENIGIIVMVAQFVEQSKQKCFKYFPEKEETMTVGKGDFFVKCTNEVNMTDYITRNLIVEKDGEQMMVKHLQFMLWPDFGCPTTTHSMLEFREIVRKHIEVTKNKAVIHCSAGVGRTGTLITIDILFQKIDNSDDDIDVFGTVLDLRQQRTHMVQTEKQYEYIHKCLRDYLIKPKTSDDGNLDPIYENVAIINGHTHTKGQSKDNTSTENLIRLKEL